MLSVRVKQRFGAFALDVDVAAPTDGVTAVFGPSGSGKTLLLRVVAGLERLHGARVVCDGETWQDGARWCPPRHRRIGYVPQEASLFPHLDVRGNLEYGLRRCAAPRLAFDAVVDMLGLARLLSQRPDTLSGGQRQRVAIGRALLASPRLLLLDEPLAALDRSARRGLLGDLRRLQRALQLPMLYVTHAADEVERLADRVLFLHDGRVDALQALDACCARLDSPLFADEGPVSVLDAEIIGWHAAHRLLELAVADLRLHIPAAARPDSGVRLRIAARDVALALQAPADSSFQNVLPVRVRALHGGRPGCRLVECTSAGGLRVFAELTDASVERLNLRLGAPVHALIKATALLD